MELPSPEVTSLLEESVALWHESEPLPSLPGRTYREEEQSRREADLDCFLESIEAEFRRLPRTRSDRDRTRERITAAFVRFAKCALDLEDRHLDLLLDGGFSAVGTALGRQARRFDPSIAAADILQACRNAWTACGFAALLGGTMQVTPAIFAYSMLYPFTDNYLDDPAISREAKVGFSRRFGERLAGALPEPTGRNETAIWRLVCQIESQYSRAQCPQVFESLLAIHRAQEQSIRLLRGAAPAGTVDVLRLSLEKGGTSVLADAWLAGGSLTPDQAGFAYRWGVLLQLGDDLQDVEQDRASGLLTIFSEAAGRDPLDQLTGRTLRFADSVLTGLDCFRTPGSETLKELICRSSRSLVIGAAGDASELYTKEYVADLEAHSPFRFGFLADRRGRLARRRGLFAKLFEAFLAGEDDEPAFPLLPSSLMPRF